MQQPLLSIVIPTYNRIELLKLCIESFVHQLDQRHNGIVEFIVVNNASTDDTANWLKETFANHIIITHCNHTDHVNAVESVMRSIEQASGEYIWVFGDDDKAMPFSLETILKMLMSTLHNNIDIFYINSLRSDAKMETYTSIYEPIIKIEPTNMTLDELLHSFHLHLGLLITLLFKRSAWIKGRAFHKDSYYGYGWLAPIIAGSKGGQCLYYPFPLSIHRVGVQRYSSEIPLYVLIGIPSMFDDFRREGIIETNPLDTWQRSFSLLDFVKVLAIAKAFQYDQKHIIWTDSVKYIHSNSKKIALKFFRYLVPSWLAKIAFNFGATIKSSAEDEKIS